MTEIQNSAESSRADNASTNQPTCTAFEVENDFNHYVMIPLSNFDETGISRTSFIPHLASLSLGECIKGNWTGVLSVPATQAVEATKTYFAKLTPGSIEPSLNAWEPGLEDSTSFTTKQDSDGQLCRISLSQNLPDGSRIEGRFGWDDEEKSIYLGFRFPGVAFTDALPDTSIMSPVKSVRTYITAGLVDALLENYKAEYPEWALSGRAPTLPEGAIPALIGTDQ